MQFKRFAAACAACTLLPLLVLTSACSRDTKIAEREAAAAAARIERIEKGLTARLPMVGEEPATLEERMEFFGVPGVAVAVIQDFQVAWTRGWGVADAASGREMTADTLVPVGGISKPVAAMTALNLVQQGRLELDAPVDDQIGDWKILGNGLTEEAPVTLRGLLSHTGGLSHPSLDGYYSDTPVPTLAQVYTGGSPAVNVPVQVMFPPSSGFRFSSGGYLLVEKLLAESEGKPFAQLATETVLGPLGMTDSAFEQPLSAELAARAATGHRIQGNAIPGGSKVYPQMASDGLWSTAADLGKLGVGLLQAVRGRDTSVLSENSAATMVTTQDGQMGMGIFVVPIGTATYLRHYGNTSGFFGVLVLSRDSGYGAAVVANSDSGGRLVEELLRSIAAEYAWEGYLNPPVEWTPLAADELAKYAGRYQLEADRVMRLEVDGDRLMAYETTRDLPDPLYPLPDGQLYRQLFNATLTFQFDEAGNAVSYSFPGPNSTEVVRYRMADGDIEPIELLQQGDLEGALAAYRAAGLPDESRLNVVGYNLLQREKIDEAVAIFELNAELFPNAPNVFDSLAEGYLTAGDKERARQYYTRVLEMLPSDSVLNPSQKQLLAFNANRQLERLQG